MKENRIPVPESEELRKLYFRGGYGVDLDDAKNLFEKIFLIAVQLFFMILMLLMMVLMIGLVWKVLTVPGCRFH